MKIIPAIIPKSQIHLRESLARIDFTSYVQIDVVDGQFVENISWPYQPEGNVSEILEDIRNYSVEVDLMVQDSVSAGRAWLKAGAKALIFHIEGVPHIDEVFNLHEEMSFQLGLALNNNTPLETIYNYLDQVDFVQLMGIDKIGAQGEPFDNRVLERVATLRGLYPSLPISVDGAVNENNILELKNAGATSFAVGSYILKSDDPAKSYQQLLKIISH